MIRRPPRSTPFPTRRSSDLSSLPTRSPRRFAIATHSSIVTPERSEEHTSELQSLTNIVCRLLLVKKCRVPHIFNSQVGHSHDVLVPVLRHVVSAPHVRLRAL